MENIDRIRKLAGLNEAYKFSTAEDTHADRDFTGREPYNSSDNGYFPPEENPNGTWTQKHKKWPQYDLFSKDGGKTYQGMWTGTARGSGEKNLPNIKNNGWLASVDLIDADETSDAGKLLMPPNLVDTAGMRSKTQGLGYSNSPSMQAKRAMQFAQQMGLKDWDPRQGFDTVSNYIPYALHISKGERFNNSGEDKQVRVPVNLFSAAERADIAKARWTGSFAPSITVGGYSIFNPGVPQYGGDDEEEDKDIVLGQPRKTPGSAAGGASDTGGDSNAGGVHTVDAGTKTPVEKVKTIPIDPKVKDMQEELLAKDPNALPRFGADGKLGTETAAAMAKYPDIAKKYMGSPMATGMTIGSTLKSITKGVVDFGKGIWKGLTAEGDNMATFEEASYDAELARIKSLSSLK
jgi:hypothetical protein